MDPPSDGRGTQASTPPPSLQLPRQSPGQLQGVSPTGGSHIVFPQHCASEQSPGQVVHSPRPQEPSPQELPPSMPRQGPEQSLEQLQGLSPRVGLHMRSPQHWEKVQSFWQLPHSPGSQVKLPQQDPQSPWQVAQVSP